MKDVVLILSKTQMNNQVCVGGLTTKGKYVRLLDEYGNNQPTNTDLEPRQAWEIEYLEKTGCRPPHVEDVLVQNRVSKGKLKDKIKVKDFIQEHKISIWEGHPDNLFDNLVQWTANGSGYIDEEGGIPEHSVGFWISDKDLIRNISFEKVRYKYPTTVGKRGIVYKGLDESVNNIPAGTLLRVSLARWKAFEGEVVEKCWLQLSGWYDLEQQSSKQQGFFF